MADKELCLVDKKITSLVDIPLTPAVTSLDLHCNHISRIESLTSAWHLRYLDLSSNRICKIEGLSSLTSLRTLNLSCNLITKVEGLNGLVNLTRLNLSYNQINNLTGLLYLHGTEYKLKHLSLHGNKLDSIDHLLQCLLGLQGLRDVTLNQDGRDNPICNSPGYWEIVMESLPQISVLDGLDRLRHPSSPGISSLCDIAGLEDYVDVLLSSDTSHNEKSRGVVTTPHIDQVLTQFRQRIASEKSTDTDKQSVTKPLTKSVSQTSCPVELTVANPTEPVDEERIRKLEHQVSQLLQKVPAGEKPNVSIRYLVKSHKTKRDIDETSDSERDSGKENTIRTRIPRHRNVLTSSTVTDETKSSKSESDHRSRKPVPTKSAVGLKRKIGGAKAAKAIGQEKKGPSGAAKTSEDLKAMFIQEEQTYRTIIEERDQEMERRWKAEQAVRKLTEEMKCLQTKVNEEKDLQSLALHTTDRLKEMLLKERSGRSELQTRIEELEERCQSLTQKLENARSSEEQHKTALRRLEESISHGDALRACQQAEQMKRFQESENRAAALKRELDIQRASIQQHKDKIQQLHELLASKEQEHRKQLELRLQPGGADFREAVSKEVASAEQRHSQRETELLEKLSEGKKQYAALEDEFRMALTIEAARFSEVKEVYDHMTAELIDVKATLAQSQQREKKSGSLVQELTAMVKEQKSRISELVRSKKEAVTELKNHLHSVEAELELDRRASVQVEILKKDKSRLLSQLEAQESVIDGLRAERKIWGEELAQQGASLAQDRGRLEARIELLTAELETHKKQNERDQNALKIKTKIIDDQTDTIRKLKENLQERDNQIRRLKDEAIEAQKMLQQQQEEETIQQADLKEQLEHLRLRKDDLKQQLGDKEAELNEFKRNHSESSKKWQEKAQLLTRLETQVKRMKENFDSKERLLRQERDKATEAQKAAVEKLRSVDDAFRQQLECIHAAHQTELLQLANEKQKKIELANQKVFDVEEEMRQLLEETQTSKRIMEEKMKRLTSVLKDF